MSTIESASSNEERRMRSVETEPLDELGRVSPVR
jgi:hypothetical protein